MKAMILAAGEGTRLLPLTRYQPKVMLPLAGKPLLEHNLLLLRSHGIRDVAINLHHLPERISDFLGEGDQYGIRILYSFENQLLGTAGAVRRLRSFFSDAFVVFYGDVLTDMNISDLVRLHRSRASIATIAVQAVPDSRQKGVVETTPEGRLVRFVEKPCQGVMKSDLANAGVYVLEPSIIDHIPPDRPCDFGHDVFPRLLELNLPISTYLVNSYLLDIGSPEAYRKAERDIAEGRWNAPC